MGSSHSALPRDDPYTVVLPLRGFSASGMCADVYHCGRTGLIAEIAPVPTQLQDAVSPTQWAYVVNQLDAVARGFLPQGRMQLYVLSFIPVMIVFSFTSGFYYAYFFFLMLLVLVVGVALSIGVQRHWAVKDQAMASVAATLTVELSNIGMPGPAASVQYHSYKTCAGVNTAYVKWVTVSVRAASPLNAALGPPAVAPPGMAVGVPVPPPMAEYVPTVTTDQIAAQSMPPAPGGRSDPLFDRDCNDSAV